MAKSRVALSKITSIPRLELSAAVTSARISASCGGKVVLVYINNRARRFHVLVANRVKKKQTEMIGIMST